MLLHTNCYPSVFTKWLRLWCALALKAALLARNRVNSGVRRLEKHLYPCKLVQEI